MGKYQINTSPENCSGCLRCQLGCSEANSRIFRITDANIKVHIKGADCVITFNEDCNECGICADNCFYGALNKTVRENTK